MEPIRPVLDRPSKWWGAPPRRRPPPGSPYKVAILGGAGTLRYAPWHDPSWQLWAHASCRNDCQRMPDLLWDLHPRALWSNPKKKSWDQTYYRWLQQNVTPIYMQEKYPDVPASLKYPFAQVIHQYRPYFTNHVAWMIALALTEGVTHIGLYGCHYSMESEYGIQRGCAEYWCGVADGRGVQVLIPPGCDLLNFPSQLYGYESHPDGVRHADYGLKQFKKPKVEKPDGTKVDGTVIDPTKAEGRPPLMALKDPGGNVMPPAWERSGLAVIG
jgi:hypothetical protein